MSEIKLTDLMDVSLLQRIQDAFSKVTGMAALTTDVNGVPVTEGSGFTDYCMKYTRKSELGKIKCEQCDQYGAKITANIGHALAYQCHSGLIDFSAPIIANGQIIGCFIGGQVLTQVPDKEFIRVVADDLQIDFEEYWEALQKVPVIPKEQITAAAEFLYEVASVMSDIAYGKYLALEVAKDVEHAANMKTDFLANMSHEIRTPMNAVIGLAEVALREELPPVARDCLSQIKSSGNALLNIINDILDFSKIESGKMDIVPIEYDPITLLNEVTNIITLRLKDKPVELLLSVNPSIPTTLYGDNLRVRQVLINLTNNAVKFTRSGKVAINVDFDKISDNEIMLRIAVQDTGIGIKEKDLEKIFHSFEQVDSKRNRNVEGTGLGLAISKQLVNLMGGDLKVASEYEKGSTFSFYIPQGVVDWKAAIQVEDAEKKAVIGYWSNVFLAKEFYSDIGKLGILSMALPSLDQFDDVLLNYQEYLKERRVYFFFDEAGYNEDVERILDEHPNVTGVLLTALFSTRKSDRPNLHIMCKPLSTLHIAMALNGENIYDNSGREKFEFDFIAPDAEVLIVDDNEVNLTVAQGLLEPLQMNITKAASGIMALDLIKKKKFNLILMDHMMPELDGVETTRIIRRYHPSYDDVPIIALTANAIGGMADKFKEEGMDDFVAKPIEIRELIKIIKKWLPKELIQTGSYIAGPKEDASDFNIQIGDLDTETALKLAGSKELYFKILKEYYRNIQSKSIKIKELQMQQDIKLYTIEVHALKSLSKQIGAMELSEIAAKLEKAGNDNNIDFINAETDYLLQKYVGYIDMLKPYCKEEKEKTGGKALVDKEAVCRLLEKMLVAVDELDIDAMEEVVLALEKYEYPKEQADIFNELQVAVGNIDVDLCEELINRWKHYYI